MPSPSSRPPLILIVDDDEYVHRLVEAAVRPIAAETLSARSGREALVIARLRQPDLILLDLALPDTDGMTLLATLRRIPALRETPVIVVSGLADHPAARSNEIAAFVAKPFRSTSLIDVIRTVLDQPGAKPRPEPRPLPA